MDRLSSKLGNTCHRMKAHDEWNVAKRLHYSAINLLQVLRIIKSIATVPLFPPLGAGFIGCSEKRVAQFTYTTQTHVLPFSQLSRDLSRGERSKKWKKCVEILYLHYRLTRDKCTWQMRGLLVYFSYTAQHRLGKSYLKLNRTISHNCACLYAGGSKLLPLLIVARTRDTKYGYCCVD